MDSYLQGMVIPYLFKGMKSLTLLAFIGSLGASSDLGGYLSMGFRNSSPYDGERFYTFYIPGLCIEKWGNIGPSVDFLIGGEYEYDRETFPILRAWFGYRLFNHHRVRFGVFYIPFGSYNQLHNPLFDRLVDPPMVLYEIVPIPWTDMGVVINGEIPWNNLYLSYNAYMVNGLGEGKKIRESRQFLDNNGEKANGGRIGILSPKNLDIGTSWYFGTRDRKDKLRIGMLGVDGALSLSNFELRGEFVSCLIDFPYNSIEALKIALGNTPIISNLIGEHKLPQRGWAYGYYLQLSYNYREEIIPVVRYGDIIYQDEFHNIDMKDSRISLGFGYHPLPPIFIKMEYDFNKERSDGFFIQAGVSF